MKYRGNYRNEDKPFFVFFDRSPVAPYHVRQRSLGPADGGQ